MRRAKGPPVDQPARAEPRRAVDLRDLERLLERERRQDRRQATGQHRLAGAGRADHQQVVAARRGDLQRALRVGVPAHVAELEVGWRRAEVPARRAAGGSGAHSPRSRSTIRLRSGTGSHLQARHQRRLLGVLLGDDQVLVAGPLGSHREGERPADRAQPAAERQLPAHRVRDQPLVGHLGRRGQQPHRDREVEARSVLVHVRGREIGGQALLGEVEAGVQEGGPHAFARLADRPVGQPDERERGKAAAGVDLDRHLAAADPVQGEGGDCGEHDRQARWAWVTGGCRALQLGCFGSWCRVVTLVAHA